MTANGRFQCHLKIEQGHSWHGLAVIILGELTVGKFM